MNSSVSGADYSLNFEDLNVANRIDQICDEFESAWKLGGRPELTQYVDDTLGHWTGRLVAELVRIDMEYRLHAGEHPSVDEYLSLYPQYSDVLSRLKQKAPFAETVVMPVRAPQRIGKYELRQPVGQGGFGAVWKAWDTQLERWVAVKIPREKIEGLDPERAFLREARAAAGLDHPHIVPVIEAGSENGTAYIVSGFVQGITLKEWRQARPLSHHEIARLCLTLATALEHAHKKGVVHRDLKPGNVLIDGEGAPHIADFGLASRKAHDRTIEPSGTLAGTPAYMAPEQIDSRAKPDHRCDVYALGTTLYELLTGSVPFAGSQAAVLHQVLHVEPTPPREKKRDIPADLETICLKAMSKDRKQRYDTAEEMAEDLRRYLNGQPIRARKATRIENTWHWVRRNPAVSAASSIAAIATIMALSLAFVPDTGAATPGKRLVTLKTDPPGARVVFYRLDERTGEPDPSQRIEAASRSPVKLELDSGRYFVVAALDDGRFHEVYRRVPPRDQKLAVAGHEFWQVDEVDSRAVRLPSVKIPESGTEAGMVRIEGTAGFLMGKTGSTVVPIHQCRVASFFVDPTEVSISLRNSTANPRFADMWPQVGDADSAAYLPYHEAIELAEKLGKRLPAEKEFEYLATNRGRSLYPWGDSPPTPDQISEDCFTVAGMTIDRLGTTPSVYGLCSNAAEWTTTFASFDPPLASLGAITTSAAGESRVVRGSLVPPESRTSADYDPRARQFVSVHTWKKGLGLRCYRSARPHLEPSDFLGPFANP